MRLILWKIRDPCYCSNHWVTRLAAAVNRQHSECVCVYNEIWVSTPEAILVQNTDSPFTIHRLAENY